MGVDDGADDAEGRADQDQHAEEGQRDDGGRTGLSPVQPHGDSATATASACTCGTGSRSSTPPGPRTDPVTVTVTSSPTRVALIVLPSGATRTPRATACATSSPRAM